MAIYEGTCIACHLHGRRHRLLLQYDCETCLSPNQTFTSIDLKAAQSKIIPPATPHSLQRRPSIAAGFSVNNQRDSLFHPNSIHIIRSLHSAWLAQLEPLLQSLPKLRSRRSQPHNSCPARRSHPCSARRRELAAEPPRLMHQRQPFCRTILVIAPIPQRRTETKREAMTKPRSCHQ